MIDRIGIPKALEGKAPALFLLAGSLMIVFAVNTYLKTFTGASYPVVQGLVAPVGFFVGVVGLFGLYPDLVDRLPTVARIAVVVTTVAAIGWIVIIGAGVISQQEPGGPLAIVPLVTIGSMILAFAMFGVISLRSGIHSRIVGTFLVVESVMFLLVILGVPGFLIDTGHVVAYLGIGVTLWTTDIPVDDPGPETGSAV